MRFIPRHVSSQKKYMNMPFKFFFVFFFLTAINFFYVMFKLQSLKLTIIQFFVHGILNMILYIGFTDLDREIQFVRIYKMIKSKFTPDIIYEGNNLSNKLRTSLFKANEEIDYDTETFEIEEE